MVVSRGDEEEKGRVLDSDGEEKEESCEPLDDQIRVQKSCVLGLKTAERSLQISGCSLDRLKIFCLFRSSLLVLRTPPVPFTHLSRSLSAFLSWRRRLGARAPSPFASSSLAPSPVIGAASYSALSRRGLAPTRYARPFSSFLLFETQLTTSI